jgi:class III poly(R)-hydroxyalkanoic acid synthase PhaE subunit
MAQHDHPFPGADWAALQHRYLEALASLGLPGAGPRGAANPWQDALDYWWRGAAAVVPEAQRPLFDDIVRQARALAACADFFAPLAALLAQPQRGGEWEAALRRQITALQQQLRDGGAAPGMESLLAAWLPGADLWQRSMAPFTRDPGHWPWPSGPAAGPFAAQAGAARDGARLWQTCQEAWAEYGRHVAGAARRGLDILGDRLVAGAEVESLRALYDLWVDCGEAAVAEMLAGEEFPACFANLVNALAALRLHGRGLVDAGLAALSLPTSRDLGDVQRREAELRGELRAARAQQREDRALLDRLQRELASLRAQGARPRRGGKRGGGEPA